MKDEKDNQRISRDQLVTLGDLEVFRKTLIEDLMQLLPGQSTGDKKWLRSSEVRKMLGISGGTLQNFRINRILPFVRINKLIYYKYEDIEKMLSQKK